MEKIEPATYCIFWNECVKKDAGQLMRECSFKGHTCMTTRYREASGSPSAPSGRSVRSLRSLGASAP